MPKKNFAPTTSVRVEIDDVLHTSLKAEAQARHMYLKDLLIVLLEEGMANAGRPVS